MTWIIFIINLIIAIALTLNSAKSLFSIVDVLGSQWSQYKYKLAGGKDTFSYSSKGYGWVYVVFCLLLISNFLFVNMSSTVANIYSLNDLGMTLLLSESDSFLYFCTQFLSVYSLMFYIFYPILEGSSLGKRRYVFNNKIAHYLIVKDLNNYYPKDIAKIGTEFYLFSNWTVVSQNFEFVELLRDISNSIIWSADNVAKTKKITDILYRDEIMNALVPPLVMIQNEKHLTYMLANDPELVEKLDKDMCDRLQKVFSTIATELYITE